MKKKRHQRKEERMRQKCELCVSLPPGATENGQDGKNRQLQGPPKCNKCHIFD